MKTPTEIAEEMARELAMDSAHIPAIASIVLPHIAAAVQAERADILETRDILDAAPVAKTSEAAAGLLRCYKDTVERERVLREALKPFAEAVGNEIRITHHNVDQVFYNYIETGHCRAARAALAQCRQEPDGGAESIGEPLFGNTIRKAISALKPLSRKDAKR